MTCNTTIERVINLYLTELPGENLYKRYANYREASETYKQHFDRVTANADEKESNALDLAVFDLLAQTERLAFRDGFIAGAGHLRELAGLTSK